MTKKDSVTNRLVEARSAKENLKNHQKAKQKYEKQFKESREYANKQGISRIDESTQSNIDKMELRLKEMEAEIKEDKTALKNKPSKKERLEEIKKIKKEIKELTVSTGDQGKIAKKYTKIEMLKPSSKLKASLSKVAKSFQDKINNDRSNEGTKKYQR